MRDVAVGLFLVALILTCLLVLRAVHLDSQPKPKTEIGTPMHVCRPDVKSC